MPIILYKAPHCLRCDIVRQFLEDRGLACETFQLDTDKDAVNAFYRTHRARLYRNAEGAEFPMFHDTDHDEIRQGTGQVLAWLLAGKNLDRAVTRSDLLHGWISGLHVSRVPEGEEDHFLELIRLLARGGLSVCLQSDGRRADLLERILKENLVSRMVVSVPGPAARYPDIAGGPAPSPEELAGTIALARGCADHLLRLRLEPYRDARGEFRWLSPAEAGEAAKMVAEAVGEMTMPFAIQIRPLADGELPEGTEPLTEDQLLPYRSKVRAHLPKTEILKTSSEV